MKNSTVSSFCFIFPENEIHHIATNMAGSYLISAFTHISLVSRCYIHSLSLRKRAKLPLPYICRFKQYPLAIIPLAVDIRGLTLHRVKPLSALQAGALACPGANFSLPPLAFGLNLGHIWQGDSWGPPSPCLLGGFLAVYPLLMPGLVHDSCLYVTVQK